MINIGKLNKLHIKSNQPNGSILSDDEGNEVFMPTNLGPLNVKAGQELEVFVYLDTKSQLVATSQKPYAQVGEYALMSVVEVQDFGAFFDFGIEKDLMVPGNEQKVKVRKFEDHIVHVCLEEGTDRVFGTTKFGKILENQSLELGEKDKVTIQLAHKSELGYRVIINKKYLGMLYYNEIFTPVKLKGEYQAVVKKIREDGLIDVALQTQGIGNLVEACEKIITMLEECGGKSILHDKSSPEAIKDILGMSKKTFKNAIGMLYKERRIVIKKDGIELTK